MLFLPILAISFWLGGYFITARTMSNRGVLSEDLEKIIAPPRWLYYLCGAPSNREYPRGTMRVVALRAQITGIALTVSFLFSYIWEFSRTEYLVGLGFVLLVSYILPAYIAKEYIVREQIKESIKIKKGNAMTPTKITDDLSYSIDGISINLYSEFGSNGGANLTIDLEELDVLIETLQNIKAFLQDKQSEKTGG